MEGFNWLTGFVFPYLNLMLFLFLASRFLKPPVITAIFKRSRDFKQALEKATFERDAALAKQKELQEKLDSYDTHLAEITDNIKAQSDEEAHAMVNHAEQLAAHIKKEAEKIARAEVDRAREQIRKEIVKEAQERVMQKIRSELGQIQHVELIKSQLGAISEPKNQTKVVNLQKVRAKG